MKDQQLGRLPFSFTLVLCASAAAFSQTAQVTGRVGDQAGAVVPGATITVTGARTGLSRETVSNDEGYFTIPLLQPGEYQIAVKKEGFKPIIQAGVKLAVDQVGRLDYQLETGAVTDTLNVTSDASLLAQETSTLGQVIDGQKIVNIPLNGRSPFRLIQLTPGVLSANSANGQFGDIPVNTTWDANFSINGGRSQANEITIDGVPATAGFFNQITTIPSVEAAQEFKVESSNVSAEHGRFGGGLINVSTRAGGNEFHGSLYEFLRNSALDANDFFNNRARRDKPPFQMNQFGGSVGGPVWLPGKVFGPLAYDGRNRTFFFFDYQGTRWRRGDVFTSTLPTERERNGDFIQTFDNTGRPVIIYDPLTTRPDPARPGQFVRDPFPGNVIPASRVDPIARESSSTTRDRTSRARRSRTSTTSSATPSASSTATSTARGSITALASATRHSGGSRAT